MNEADKKAFAAAYVKWKSSDDMISPYEYFWQAACEWRDSQSPTAQINQRLVEALEIIAGRKQCIDNLMSNADIAKAALDAVRSGK